ncbi:MAG: Gfo/Idh/MocA family oxidoreductase [Flavobacteriaceae bacterium]|jgi:predicted dehydrogenase|nr:Gfo/Idh/MocA family oxidoreductase [Flavobacteriaceae bacterium]MDG1969297.1 Gfo/Idh/MocA family oxidoreductase [Flavobacteriaceae bacterium]|tara:strand:+ start:373 stop:1515 length:1143 start_codon:yes stop_codon:yes gene_type:complete
MSKIRLGVLGGGGDSLIGVLHRVASYMYDYYEIVGGVFNPDYEENIKFAKKIGVNTDRVYKDFDEFVAVESAKPEDERVEVVSVLTPNFLHYPMAKKLLEHGFNVICEKPLTTTLEEAKTLQEIQKKNKAVFAVTYTYTGYPMVREMKEMIAKGVIGDIHKVDLQYYQGWINPVIHDKEKRSQVWRLDPKKAGISSCIGDIGTHIFNMVEYVTGSEVSELLSDLNTLYEDNPLDIDGSVLIRMDNKAKGILRASQIATGDENNITVAIFGRNGALKWEQENPNYLYLLKDDEPRRLIKPGNASYNTEVSLDGTKLPAGHPEGIFDAMGNIYRGVAKALRGENSYNGEFPTLYEGVRGMLFIEKTVESNQNGNVWVSMENQ